MANSILSGIIPAAFAKLIAKPQNNNAKTNVRSSNNYVSKIIPKTISRVRIDISTWKNALRAADNVDTPRRTRLNFILEDILTDAYLSSQIELRIQRLIATPFELKRNGEKNEEATALLTSAMWRAKLDRYAFGSVLFGHSLVEFITDNSKKLDIKLFPRGNVIPETGTILLREDDNKGIDYYKLPEFGTWILEFGDQHDYGLLNKAVPHVLFMRFAQSCWSELCEIYGIPPRVMKTNTQDAGMIDRAEQMMRDMGSAAWFIIDETESFEFAKATDTNGDVYRNLMGCCKEVLSVLINGAVVGQDTINGNRSKEESSLKLVDNITQADRRRQEGLYNSIIIPALVRIGFLPEGLTFEYQQEEDLEKLWKQTHEALEYFEVDPVWIKDKFGISVIGKRELPSTQGLNADFFV